MRLKQAARPHTLCPCCPFPPSTLCSSSGSLSRLSFPCILLHVVTRGTTLTCPSSLLILCAAFRVVFRKTISNHATPRPHENDRPESAAPLGPHLSPGQTVHPRKLSNLTDQWRETHDSMSEQCCANRRCSLNSFIPRGSPWL